MCRLFFSGPLRVCSFTLIYRFFLFSVPLPLRSQFSVKHLASDSRILVASARPQFPFCPAKTHVQAEIRRGVIKKQISIWDYKSLIYCFFFSYKGWKKGRNIFSFVKKSEFSYWLSTGFWLIFFLSCKWELLRFFLFREMIFLGMFTTIIK